MINITKIKNKKKCDICISQKANTEVIKKDLEIKINLITEENHNLQKILNEQRIDREKYQTFKRRVRNKILLLERYIQKMVNLIFFFKKSIETIPDKLKYNKKQKRT